MYSMWKNQQRQKTDHLSSTTDTKFNKNQK